jgi:uncharacterized membrane protein
LGRPVTLIVFTLLALIELIADKLPNTPARTAPLGLIARIAFGCLAVLRWRQELAETCQVLQSSASPVPL